MGYKVLLSLLFFIGSQNLTAKIAYSLTFLIHEDNEYSYHELGKKKYAFKETFRKPKTLQNPVSNVKCLFSEKNQRSFSLQEWLFIIVKVSLKTKLIIKEILMIRSSPFIKNTQRRLLTGKNNFKLLSLLRPPYP